MIKHGIAARGKMTPEYHIWLAMRSRCRNPKDKAWKNYGGRGLCVCDRWDDFAAFISDVGLRPSASHSLDRIDNERGYEVGNVRWATKREQVRNMRRNRIYTHGGKTMCMKDWAEFTGIHVSCLRARLNRGLDIAAAISTDGGVKRGEDNGFAKLTSQSVREIVVLHKSGRAVRWLSQTYRVHTTTIQRVLSGRLWLHATKDLIAETKAEAE
jgi:hypothetical protein